jgi:hypothetical protein
VADSTISAIDRIFDLVDNLVERTDHALHRGKQTEEKHRARHTKKPPEAIDAASTVKTPSSTTSTPSTPSTPSTSSTALATRRCFRIVESITPETGVMIFVVTNGAQRAECTTRELAEKIMRGLEAAP